MRHLPIVLVNVALTAGLLIVNACGEEDTQPRRSFLDDGSAPTTTSTGTGTGSTPTPTATVPTPTTTTPTPTPDAGRRDGGRDADAGDAAKDGGDATVADVVTDAPDDGTANDSGSTTDANDGAPE